MFGNKSWFSMQREHSQLFGAPRFFLPRFKDGDDDPDKNKNKKPDDKKDDDDDDDPDLKPKDGKTFTQEQVDKIVAKNKRKTSEAHLRETEALLKDKDLSKKERDRLEARKVELEEQLMTEKQQGERRYNKLKEEYEEKLKASDSNGKKWQDRFSRSIIRRTLIDAAREAGAHDPEQIFDLFAGKVQPRAIKDEQGNETDDFEVVIEVVEKDGEGKTKKRVIPIEKYIVEEHSVSDRAANLYDSKRKGGTGDRPGSGGGKSTKGDATKEEKISRGLDALKAGKIK